MPARSETVMVRDFLPKEFCGCAVFFVACVSVPNKRTVQLGHLCIAMQTREAILVPHERIENGSVIEPVRKLEPALVSGIRVKVCQHLRHAPKLGVEHLL